MSTRSLWTSSRLGVSQRLGLIQITVTALVWGSGGVVVQLLHTHTGLDPVSIAFYRLAVAAPLLLVATARKPLMAELRRRPGLLVATGIGLATYQALYFVAVADAGVAVATMLSLGLAPVLITFGETIHNRRLPAPTTTLMITAAICGLVLISVGGLQNAGGAHRWLGLACGGASGLGYAITTALSGRMAATMSPSVLAAITTTVGAMVLAPVAAVIGLGFTVTTGSVLALAYLGPITTAAAYVLFYLGLRTTAARTAAMLTLLEPLAAAVLAQVVLAQPLTAMIVSGGALMLTAVAILYALGEP
jgi:DME family drug/metabolite transporter